MYLEMFYRRLIHFGIGVEKFRRVLNLRISFPNDLREVVHRTHSSSSVTYLPSILFSYELFPPGTLWLMFPFMLILLLCSVQVFVIILCVDDF